MRARQLMMAAAGRRLIDATGAPLNPATSASESKNPELWTSLTHLWRLDTPTALDFITGISLSSLGAQAMSDSIGAGVQTTNGGMAVNDSVFPSRFDDPFTVFAVFKPYNLGGFQGLVSSFSSTYQVQPYLGFDDAQARFYYAGGSFTNAGSVAEMELHVMAAQYIDQTQTALWLDGVNLGTFDPKDSGRQQNPSHLGTISPDNGYEFDGLMYAAGVYNAAITNTKLDAIAADPFAHFRRAA